MSGKGGNRKLHKFHQQQQEGKKRLFITDFLVAKHSKQKHLELPKVISAKTNVERENKSLNFLITKLKQKETARDNTAVVRCRLNEIRPGFFFSPRTSDEIKVVYDWTTSIEEITTLEKAIKD